ncbi:hypothetical protein Acr_16g0000250 [Actinidia rufa]|uniref:CCHC-type domain-containing protein n=1 Tax=Actinidia rufa TaxID=165716 RepID=A0A7J0FXH9_9ERIC|nr:hypothetical protein Acr_16g0000250 [Actinidia rufa]
MKDYAIEGDFPYEDVGLFQQHLPMPTARDIMLNLKEKFGEQGRFASSSKLKSKGKKVMKKNKAKHVNKSEAKPRGVQIRDVPKGKCFHCGKDDHWKRNCPVFIARKRNASKLEARLKVCLFVGYPKGTKGDLFYNPNEKKVFVSTNVIYLEEDYMMNHKPRSQIVLEEMAGTQNTPVNRIISTSTDNILAPEVVPDTSVPNPVQTPEPRRSGRTVRQPDRLMFLGKTYEAIQEE